MTQKSFASFEAVFPVDAEFDRPEGCFLARKIERAFRSASFQTGEFDNWRDCGWFVPCGLADIQFWVCFAHYSEKEPWQLFVEPLHLPGLVRRILGKPRPAYISYLQRVTVEVDKVLRNEPSVAQLRWTLRGDPRKVGVPDLSSLPWPSDAVA